MQNAPSVATTTDSPALNELERATALEVEAKDELERLLQWNRQDAQSLDLHEVERGLFKRLIALGLTLLLCHLARRGTGKGGGEVLRDGVPLPYHSNLRLLLEGKVGYVIGGLRQSVTQRKLRGRKREAVETAIGYMVRNRDFMRYDEYLAKGYPIGSGVVEGACRHLVKDRMELGGMHWSKPGAQAILELRAVETNGDWNGFWRFHVGEESARLHGAITRRDSRGFEYFPRPVAA